MVRVGAPRAVPVGRDCKWDGCEHRVCTHRGAGTIQAPRPARPPAALPHRPSDGQRTLPLAPVGHAPMRPPPVCPREAIRAHQGPQALAAACIPPHGGDARKHPSITTPGRCARRAQGGSAFDAEPVRQTASSAGARTRGGAVRAVRPRTLAPQGARPARSRPEPRRRECGPGDAVPARGAVASRHAVKSTSAGSPRHRP